MQTSKGAQDRQEGRRLRDKPPRLYDYADDAQYHGTSASGDVFGPQPRAVHASWYNFRHEVVLAKSRGVSKDGDTSVEKLLTMIKAQKRARPAKNVAALQPGV